LVHLPREDTAMLRRCATRSMPLCFALLAACSLVGPLPSAKADITPTGDVSPSNPPPINWTGLTTAYIGNTGFGTLVVDGSSHLQTQYAYVGYGNTATGVVNVAGTGSAWTSGYELDVGIYGSGTLSITGGGSVISNISSSIGSYSGSTGAVTVDGAGSTLTTSSTYVGRSGNGTLSVTSGGSVSSGWSHIGNDYGSTGAVTVDGAGSTWSNGGNIYIGDSGSGTLSITSGGAATCNFYSYIGNSSGGNGLVTVSGAGSTWTNSATLYVGNSGSGTLSISNGGAVASNYGLSCYVGNCTGSTGMVTVDGAGSEWTNSGNLYVGNSGSGTLSIAHGGAVGSDSVGIGAARGGAGDVTVDGAGSKWTNNSFLTVGGSGSGALSITNGATVSSTFVYIGDNNGSFGAVTVDGTGSKVTTSNYLFIGHSGNGALSITNGGGVSAGGNFCDIGENAGSKGIVTVAGNGSTWTYGGPFFLVGNAGSGTLSIVNGGAVNTNSGTLGYAVGSSGSVAVSGTNSQWNDSSGLFVGRYGSGTISISGGGAISSASAYIGYYSGPTGVAIVDGAGSKWTNSGSLSVGTSGIATLSITGGGVVAANSVSVNGVSLVAVDVGRGSSLTIAGGTGTFTNNGKLRLLAGAGIPVNDSIMYLPIAAKTWSGSGTCQPIGGTWNATSHKFTASSVASGVSGSTVPLELSSVQRAIFDDNGPGGTNWEVGASFVAAGSMTNISFTATAMSDATFGTLDGQLSPTEAILSGWMFSGNGYTVSSSNPVYLSFNVGANHPANNVEVWHYDDASGWAKYGAFDLTYDGTYASFTATGLGGYAMVAVPEPSTLVLLGLGAVSLLAWRRRRRAA
jgi:T5SS/PEP-CTERM-associated repeat protein